MTAAVPAAEARALPSATPRPIAPAAASVPARIAPTRAAEPVREDPARDAPASRPADAPTVPADRATVARDDAASGPSVVRNAAGRTIDPAVADRLRADPLVRQVAELLDAPVQRVVPRRGRPAPTRDEAE